MAEQALATIPTASNPNTINQDTIYRAFSGENVTVGDLYESLTRVYELTVGIKNTLGVLSESFSLTGDDAGTVRMLLHAVNGISAEINPIYPDLDPEVKS